MSILATLGAAAFNNAMAEYHANKADKRAQNLMDKQNAMNQANALSAYSNQVQGMRMAGLNPALSQNLGNAPVQSVSQGTGAHGENVEMSPQDLLLKAQAENLEANTNKVKAETGNVNEDTDLKFAQRLLAGANTNKVKEETANLHNINDTFVTQNRTLSETGKAMADKWKSSEWFDKLAPQTQETIEAIANGEVPLTVGAMKALEQTVAFQRDLSEADRKLVSNAFDNAIAEAMFNDKSVMDAIAKEPKKRQEMLNSQITKINAELPEIRARITNLLADTANKKMNNKQMEAELESFKRQDLGYLKSKGEYGKWLEGYAEQLLQGIFPMVVGGTALKMTRVGQSIQPPKDSGPKPPFTTNNNPNSFGVDNFNFKF